MWSIHFVVVLFCLLKNVFALNKVFCEPEDNECLTNAVREHVFQSFVGGVPGIETSDPLPLDTIIVDLPNLKYTLKNPSLIGMKNCDFLKLKLTKESTVTYELLCPRLVIQSEYEAKGEIDSTAIEGNGNCKITYENYFISINGKYERVIGEDSKPHFHIIEFTNKLDLQAGVTFEYQNLSTGGKEIADEHSKKLEEETRDFIMQKFLEKFMHKLQDFQRIMPIEDLHYRYV